MNNDDIVNKVIAKLLSEAEAKPNGLKVTEKAQADSKKNNDEYYKDTTKKMADYSKSATKSEIKGGGNAKETVEANLSGMEGLEYSSEPSEEFKKRAKDGLVGSPTMGNGTDEPGNTEPVWDASDAKFGEKKLAGIKKAKKEKDANGIEFVGPMKNLHQVSKENSSKIGASKKLAFESIMDEINFNPEQTIEEDVMADKNYTHFAILKKTGQIMNAWNYSGEDPEDIKDTRNGDMYFFNDIQDQYPDEGIRKGDVKISGRKNLQVDPENIENWYRPNNEMDEEFSDLNRKGGITPMYEDSNPSGCDPYHMQHGIKENKTSKEKLGMKRLKYKSIFNGMNNAIKLIPESYKTDGKTFEITDGIETYGIRWEGTLQEGAAVVLKSSNATLINEDILKIKHLMNFDAKKTLGTLSEQQKIDENLIFDLNMRKKVVLRENEEDAQESDKVEEEAETKPELTTETTDKFRAQKLDFGQFGPRYVNFKKANYIKEGENKSITGVEYHIVLENSNLNSKELANRIIETNKNKKPMDKKIGFNFYDSKGVALTELNQTLK